MVGTSTVPSGLITPADLTDPIRDYIGESIDGPIEQSRIAQLAKARKNYLYYQGKQYLAPYYDDAQGTFGWSPITEDSRWDARTMRASTYNIVQGDGEKFKAVVSQRPPNQKAVPDRSDDEAAAEAARDADAYIRYLHREWKLRDRMAEIAFNLWTVGPVYLYTRYVSDEKKYGIHREPVVAAEEMSEPAGYRCMECGTKADDQFVCPQCGAPEPEFEEEQLIRMPVETGEFEEFPRGAVELGIYNSLYVITPFEAKCLEECHWLTFTEMRPESWLKARYGEKVTGIWDQLGADEEFSSERRADQYKQEIDTPDRSYHYRQTSADTRRRHDIRWLRPENFYAFPEAWTRKLLQQFPKGLRITRVGGTVIEAENERMDDYWAVCKPGTAEQINAAPLCEAIMPIQDDINDFFNMARETILRAIPKMAVDNQLLDREAAQKNEPKMAELLFVNAGGQDIGRMMQQLPMAKFSEQLVPFGNLLREYSRELDGVMPAIFGGGEGDTTWRAASQRKNQALMQLTPAFKAMQKGVNEATANGVREGARYGVGTVTAPVEDYFGMDEAREVRFENLTSEGWHIESYEQQPVSWGEQVDRVTQIIMENPEMAGILGLTHPMNASRVQDMFGVETLPYKAGMIERDRAMDLIQRLLGEQPIIEMVPQFDPMGNRIGEQPQERSSIPPDPVVDKGAHGQMAEIFQVWLRSRAAAAQEQENPDGWKNVWLHCAEQQQAEQAEMMQAAMPAGPEAPAQEPETEIPEVTAEPAPEEAAAEVVA